jgi:hypothetical protein
MANPRSASSVRSDRRHTFYWMNTWAVWVQVSKGKVDNRSERTRALRRRKRGLRVGKRRSRGGKPPRTASTRPAPPKQCGERSIKRACREFDFWDAKLSDLVRIVKERALASDWFDSQGNPTRFSLFVQRRLSAFNRGLMRSSMAVRPLLVPSVSFLLEKHCRITWPGCDSAWSTLSQLRPSERYALARTLAELDLRDQGIPVTKPGVVCRHCGARRHPPWLLCPRLADLGKRVAVTSQSYKKKGKSKRKRTR